MLNRIRYIILNMITKITFRKEIKHLLLDEMIKGKIEPGHRISLPTLANKLEISVTPIREALTQLTETGLVTYIPNRGFFVTELTENEALDIYDAIALLESDAIKKSEYSKLKIEILKKINNQFKKENNPANRLSLDIKFHKELTNGYTNSYLLKTLEDLRIRVFIYEHNFMTKDSVEESAKMHQDIINQIENGQMEKASALVVSNWKISIDHILSYYKSK